MDLATFVILGFACWRITNLLSSGVEAGPYNVLHRIRKQVGVEYDEYSQAVGTNEVAKVFACPWCFSVWIGAVVTLTYYLFPEPTLYLIGYPFGLAGVVVLINRIIRGH